MRLHELRTHTRRRARRVGRGGRRGKTSGRGGKGQTARAGRPPRPAIRDVIKKLPKQRGRGKNIFNRVTDSSAVVNVSALERAFQFGETVSPAVLAQKRLIRKQNGHLPAVKILGDGAITKSIIVHACAVSKSARIKIEQAGGKIE